jgi:putative aldouronate transport system permease protein
MGKRNRFSPLQPLGYFILILLAFLCIAPFIYTLAVSFSSRAGTARGGFYLWPHDFNTAAYQYVLGKPEFRTALGVSILRVCIGVPMNMILTILAAYPLSKPSAEFKTRTIYVWVLVFTMLWSGGLMPTYMLIYKLGLMNTLFALILPGAVPVFNVVLMLNFFRGLPKSLEESAKLDGANHWIILFSIYLPLSLASIATLSLFSFIGHWNSWYDGIIYMSSNNKYPLSSYLQTLIIMTDMDSLSRNLSQNMDIPFYKFLSAKNMRSAQIIVGAFPLIAVYPFVQRYFKKGMTLGSLKE